MATGESMKTQLEFLVQTGALRRETTSESSEVEMSFIPSQGGGQPEKEPALDELTPSDLPSGSTLAAPGEYSFPWKNLEGNIVHVAERRRSARTSPPKTTPIPTGPIIRIKHEESETYIPLDQAQAEMFISQQRDMYQAKIDEVKSQRWANLGQFGMTLVGLLFLGMTIRMGVQTETDKKP